MKLYLSSYKLGDDLELFREHFAGRKIGYVPNALDFSKADSVRVKALIHETLQQLEANGVKAGTLDLRHYFGRRKVLAGELAALDGVWVSGGNTFVLRQAMKLSGFDELLQEIRGSGRDFVYGGFSAAGCVLSRTLKGYDIVDDATDLPYEDQRETLWDGLGLIDVAFLPHFKSDHPESADVDKEVARCEEHGIPYKTLRDGEVWVLDA